MLIVSSTGTSTSIVGLLNSASPLVALSIKSTPPNSVNASFAVPKLKGGRGRKWTKAVGDQNHHQSVTVASSPDSAAAVVRNFYEGINAHDVDSVQYLIAQNCVYDDLVFPRPFVGRKVIKK